MGLNTSAFQKMMKPAVVHFWQARNAASVEQHGRGTTDQGNRSGVTAGKNLDLFCTMIRQIIIDNGVPDECIYTTGRSNLTIPGFFRPTKNWDLLVVKEGKLLAAIELKSQVGPSFGNNFNNRTEEALGNATDILTAYREGAFGHQSKPFLGFFFVLEDCIEATRPVRITSKHFPNLDEFDSTGYADRYGLLCQKLIHENLYDSAALVLTPKSAVKTGEYRNLSESCGPEQFAKSLAAKILAFN